MQEFGILKVCYDETNGIKEVECCDLKELEGYGVILTRNHKSKEIVILEIESKISNYFTMINGKRAAEVEVVEEDNKKYIRTKGNSEKKDNLGELPTYIE